MEYYTIRRFSERRGGERYVVFKVADKHVVVRSLDKLVPGVEAYINSGPLLITMTILFVELMEVRVFPGSLNKGCEEEAP